MIRKSIGFNYSLMTLNFLEKTRFFFKMDFSGGLFSIRQKFLFPFSQMMWLFFEYWQIDKHRLNWMENVFPGGSINFKDSIHTDSTGGIDRVFVWQWFGFLEFFFWVIPSIRFDDDDDAIDFLVVFFEINYFSCLFITQIYNDDDDDDKDTLYIYKMEKKTTKCRTKQVKPQHSAASL